MKVSDQLKSLREHLGLNQSQIGQMLGMSRNLVSMVEKGHRPLSRAAKLLFEDLWEKHMSGKKTPIESEFSRLEDRAGKLETMGSGRALLKAARERQHFSQKELAAAVGYSLAVYQDIEEGRANMSRKMAERIAKELRVEVDDLLNGADEPPSNGVHFGTVGATPPLSLQPGSKARYVPLLSMAQCGAMGAYDDSAYDHTGFLAIDPKDGKAFSVRLAGESMMPVLAPGDIAVVYPSFSPKNNGLVLARLDDDHGSDVMVKLFQATQDQVTLISYNPLFPPLTYPRVAFSWIYPIASVSKVFLE